MQPGIIDPAMSSQVDALSRQAAMAEVLQHRIVEQEEVLQLLQQELEKVEEERVRAASSDIRLACS